MDDAWSMYEEVRRKIDRVQNMPTNEPYHYTQYPSWEAARAQAQYGPVLSTADINCASRRTHRVESTTIDYVDGVFISFCASCGMQIVIEKIPSELPKVKLKAMLADLLNGDDVDVETLSRVIRELDRERILLEEAEAQLRLLEAKLSSRYKAPA